MSSSLFECVSCGSDFDRESSVSDCRVCHRTHCDQCISDEGHCVPCKEDHSK